MASTGVTNHLPPVKSVKVYRNGDPFFSGRRFVVNQRQIATMDAFLNDVTLNIGAPLAVRTLYTPRYGHRVSDLSDLQQGAQYVAAGSERFKKLDYLSVGLKKGPMFRAVEPAQAKTLVRPNVSAKWRKVITLPCIIHVFRNGDILSPAMRLIIPRHMQKNLEQILSLISEKAMLRTGAVRRICTLEGFTVTSSEELETGQCYVAVGSERFKKLPYVEILLNKATGSSADRHYAGDRGLQRRIESRKMFPQDTHSDSTLLNSPEREGRRVKSTGDEVERESSPQPVKRRGRRADREENSIFYARPVRVRRQQPSHRPTPRATTDEPSVFKASKSRMREEVRGAEEVAEDENTAVELPVDQREAEIVEDEEPPEREFDESEMKMWDDTAPQTKHPPQHETNRHDSESPPRHSRLSSPSLRRHSPRLEETQLEPIGGPHDEQTDRDADSPLQAEDDA